MERPAVLSGPRSLAGELSHDLLQLADGLLFLFIALGSLDGRRFTRVPLEVEELAILI